MAKYWQITDNRPDTLEGPGLRKSEEEASTAKAEGRGRQKEKADPPPPGGGDRGSRAKRPPRAEQIWKRKKGREVEKKRLQGGNL